MAGFKGHYELTNVSNTHTMIADWLIANPGKGQMERCAAHFGYTRAWLSTLIHQDAFQGMLRAKQGEAYERNVIPIHEKMLGLAHASVEKLGEVLESTSDERLVKDIAKDTLTALGYGSGAALVINNTQNNSFTVDESNLAEARERRLKHYGGDILENHSKSSGDPQKQLPEGLPETSTTEMGQASPAGAELLYSEEAMHWEEEERIDLRATRK